MAKIINFMKHLCPSIPELIKSPYIYPANQKLCQPQKKSINVLL